MSAGTFRPPSTHRVDLAIRLAFVIPLALAAVLVLGFTNLVPVSTSSYSTTTGSDCMLCAGGVVGSVDLPGGRNVTLSWSDVTGGTVLARLQGPGIDGPVVPHCTETGAGGGCSFTSYGGNYSLWTFDARTGQGPQHVSFTATYYIPLI